MNKKQLTVAESACIITGYGIGGGVMAMPYLAQKNGVVVSLLILAAAFGASFVLHVMIAELAVKSGGGSQIIEVFSRYLFQGKYQKVLTAGFFVIMALVLFTNLAAYISGAAEIISELLGISLWLSRLLFYAAAASVVLFGLKAVGISEKLAVTVIFLLVGVLAFFSLAHINNPLPVRAGRVTEGLAYFGMAMFAFSAFFSVPQAVAGLGGDGKKVKKAVFLGLMNNFVLIVVISVCALLSSVQVTEVAMIGWSQGIGSWAEIVGSLFTILAMLTTYWSISLALSDIVAFTQNLLGYCDAAIAFDDLCRSGRFYGVYASGRWADCDFDSAACGSGLPKGVPGAGEFPFGEMGRRRDADNDYAGLFFNGCGKCGDDLE